MSRITYVVTQQSPQQAALCESLGVNTYAGPHPGDAIVEAEAAPRCHVVHIEAWRAGGCAVRWARIVRVEAGRFPESSFQLYGRDLDDTRPPGPWRPVGDPVTSGELRRRLELAERSAGRPGDAPN